MHRRIEASLKGDDCKIGFMMKSKSLFPLGIWESELSLAVMLICSRCRTPSSERLLISTPMQLREELEKHDYWPRSKPPFNHGLHPSDPITRTCFKGVGRS